MPRYTLCQAGSRDSRSEARGSLLKTLRSFTTRHVPNGGLFSVDVKPPIGRSAWAQI